MALLLTQHPSSNSPMKLFLILTTVLLLLPLAAQDRSKAQPPEAGKTAATASPPAPTPAPAPENESFQFQKGPSVRLDVLMVAVPEERVLPLVPQLRDASKVDAAQATILEWITAKQARLLDWPELSLYDKQRSVSESILEHAYPAELEPPPSVPSLAAAPGAKSDKAEAAQISADKALATLRANGLVPTTFETRNTGATLEAEAAIAPDRKAVSLQLSVQYVNSDREQEFPAGRTEKGDAITIKRPIFKDAKTSCIITLRDGERRLIYFGKPLQPGNEIVLFLIGAKISPANP
jgi:hypothetical protein